MLRIPAHPLGGGVVYRFKNAEGELIYVGVTGSLKTRVQAHRGRSFWFSEVASVEATHYRIYREAKAAELEAIRNQRPRYNKRYNPDWEQRAAMEQFVQSRPLPRKIDGTVSVYDAMGQLGRLLCDVNTSGPIVISRYDRAAQRSERAVVVPDEWYRRACEALGETARLGAEWFETFPMCPQQSKMPHLADRETRKGR